MIDPLRELSRAARVVSIARDHKGREIGWYRADVDVAVDVTRDGQALRYVERGQMRAVNGKRSAATNRLRWSLEGDELVLEHERMGEPVVIARFAIDELADGAETLEPHPCDKDLYIGRMTLTVCTVELDWTVRTPRGDERVRTRYRLS